MATEHLVRFKIAHFQPSLHFVLGFVFKAEDRANGNKKVALKRTQKAGDIVSREYEILKLLEGAQNVVQLVDFFYS